MHNLRARRLLQRELVVAEGLVYVQLEYVKGDVAVLPRALDLNAGREREAAKILVIGVGCVGRNVPLHVVNSLFVGQQVGTAELDPAPQIPPLRSLADDGQLIVWLLDAMLLGVEDRFIAVFEHGDLAARSRTFRTDLSQQQGLVDI